MEYKKISIILPVYNTKDYLERCFHAIQRQRYKDIEVIIIDDGSTDGSDGICKKICEEDSRFQYYYKENSGVSAARNRGIELAKGDLITFVDSDDWIEENIYEKMVLAMNKDHSDMIVCDAVIWEDGKDKYIDSVEGMKESCLLSKEEISMDILYQLAGAVWRCMYRSSMIKDNKVGFPVGLKLSEDRIFNIYCIGCCKRISYLKEGLYFRYVRVGSAVYQRHRDMDEIALYAYREMIKAINRTGFASAKVLYDEQFLGICYKAIDEISYIDGKISFFYKYKKIRNLCCTEEVKNALKHTKHKYPKTGLMKTRMYLLLTLISMLSQCKVE